MSINHTINNIIDLFFLNKNFKMFVVVVYSREGTNIEVRVEIEAQPRGVRKPSLSSILSSKSLSAESLSQPCEPLCASQQTGSTDPVPVPEIDSVWANPLHPHPTYTPTGCLQPLPANTESQWHVNQHRESVKEKREGEMKMRGQGSCQNATEGIKDDHINSNDHAHVCQWDCRVLINFIMCSTGNIAYLDAGLFNLFNYLFF